jgi:hypothetical protein
MQMHFQKFVIVLLLAVAFGSSAYADRLGIIAGYRSNSANYDQTGVTYNSTGGYQAGLLYQWSFAEIFALRTGLVYANKDVQFTPAGLSGFTQHASYLDIPIDLQLNLPVTGLYFYAGVKEGIKSGSSCDAPSGFTCSADVTSTDTVFNAGLGYELISFGAGALALEAEYESGLSNVNNTTGSTANIKTNAWAGNVVAWFGF